MRIVFLATYLSCARHFSERVAAYNNEPLQTVCLRGVPQKETTERAKEVFRHSAAVGQVLRAVALICGAELFRREK